MERMQICKFFLFYLLTLTFSLTQTFIQLPQFKFTGFPNSWKHYLYCNLGAVFQSVRIEKYLVKWWNVVALNYSTVSCRCYNHWLLWEMIWPSWLLILWYSDYFLLDLWKIDISEAILKWRQSSYFREMACMSCSLNLCLEPLDSLNWARPWRGSNPHCLPNDC